MSSFAAQVWKDNRAEETAKRGEALKQQLAPLSQSLQSDQTRLALYADPKNPEKALPGHEDEYQRTIDNMSRTIGQMRTVLGQKVPGENPNQVESGMAGLLDKLHITNHLKNHVAAARSGKVNDWYDQNRQTAGQYAEAAMPYEQTPEGQAEARKHRGALEIAQLRGTMREYTSPDGKERNWFRPGDEPAGWNASQGQVSSKRQKATFTNPATKQSEDGSFDPATGKYYNAAGEEVPGAQPYVKPGAMTPFSEWKKENPTGTVEEYERMMAKFHPASQMLGTWTIAEDATGTPKLFNSKTGQERDAPEGMHKSGYYAKQIAPLEAAKLNIDDYMSNGVFDGPGDLALQHAFFTATQPSTGFRMTKVQQDILQNSQNWINSWQAKLHHATTGTWFSDEQRQQIAKAARDAIEAKKQVFQSSPDPAGPVHHKNRQAQQGGKSLADRLNEALQ